MTIKTAPPHTIHVGIDLVLYVGSPVYSFELGVVVDAVGYNPAHGDYGHVVVVVRYETPQQQQQ
jgi:murein DD-endopeptidase MepM/ murein hydrolase activator NlpD